MKTFRQFYEEMMVANAPGTSGGFSASSAAEGPVSGNDKKLGKVAKRKRYIGLGPGSRKRWMKKDG